MKKIKVLPSILMLIACVAILGVGVFAVAPTVNSISGSITLDVVNEPIQIKCYLDTTEEKNLIEEFNEVRTGIKWTKDINDLKFDLSSANTIEDVPERVLIMQITNPTAKKLVAYFTKNDSVALVDTLTSSDGTAVADVNLKIPTILNAGATIEMTITLKASSFLTVEAKNAIINYYLTVENYSDLEVSTADGQTTTKKVVIPKIEAGTTTLTKEMVQAYNGNSNIEALIIPEGIDTIATFVDDGATGVLAYSSFKTVVLPSTITQLSGKAFYRCGNLKSIIIPDNVQTIGDLSFYGCSNLVSVKLPSGLTKVLSEMFVNCSNLKHIEIPTSVVSISDGAFNGCSSLTSIEIPSGVTLIATRLFNNCSSLTSVKISSTVNKIEAEAFMGCSSLTNIKLPSGVTYLGHYAFSGCSNLTSIEIPSTVSSINEGAFQNCSSLNKIVVRAGTAITFGCYLPGNYTLNETTACTSSTAIARVADKDNVYIKNS